ncbi:hypothetical protein [Chromobacterium sphagni]|uniref:hypothetical protein n=1 Tax=Chromobacterium sphagni TaxID=1903179 RepID=UPI00111409E6|nr:hypothetical protein [Chromobacterium sphagni]
MARRKELKSIASGLLGSFISRNNDVGGYWGIGKLCLLAQQYETNAVRIELLAKSIVPASLDLSKLVTGYYFLMQRHLIARAILVSWVSCAVIELDFRPEYPSGKHVPITIRGNLFKITVEIIDDMKKRHLVSSYGYCGPHDSRMESKSAGSERF